MDNEWRRMGPTPFNFDFGEPNLFLALVHAWIAHVASLQADTIDLKLPYDQCRELISTLGTSLISRKSDLK